MTDTLPKSDRLKGKVAIVTGAGCVGSGWGNGRAVAVIFAMAGAKVFAIDRDLGAMEETLERIREAGGEVTPFACDVTDSQAVASMVAACKAAYGQVDILVNNVGGSAAGGAVALAEDKFDAQIALNLRSVYLTCKHVLPLMEAQGGGSIINTASTSGTRWTGSAQVAYAASKAGVIQLSRVTAVEYAPKGIRVNTVVPGQLHTPMVGEPGGAFRPAQACTETLNLGMGKAVVRKSRVQFANARVGHAGAGNPGNFVHRLIS